MSALDVLHKLGVNDDFTGFISPIARADEHKVNAVRFDFFPVNRSLIFGNVNAALGGNRALVVKIVSHIVDVLPSGELFAVHKAIPLSCGFPPAGVVFVCGPGGRGGRRTGPG